MIIFALIFPSLSFSAPVNIAVLLPEDSGPYLEFIDALRTSEYLPDDRSVALHTITLGDEETMAQKDALLSKADLIVTAGRFATQLAITAKTSIPIIATLIPRLAYLDMLSETPRDNITAIYIDQPTERQFALIRLALPKTKTIGILVGATSSLLSEELKDFAKKFHFHPVIVKQKNEKQIAASLYEALERSDVLLAVPDPKIYNRFTIQNILLAAFRRGVPVVGFSNAYVNAGALVAVYSTPAQIGQQLAKIIQQYYAESFTNLPPAQFPQDFTVAVNGHVARSMNLSTKSAAVLKRQLEQYKHIRTGS